MQQPDAIIAALATMRQGLMQVDGPYTPDQVERRLGVISMLRDYCREENSQGFTDYCQELLCGTSYRCSQYVDSGALICDILEEIYGHLDLPPETTMWDDFASRFL